MSPTPQTSAAPSLQPGGYRPPAPPLCLPREVLEAPAVRPGVSPPDAGWVFIERMDEWRRALGWSHKEFAARLGITERYWYFMLRHEKELTIGVAERVIRERPELELILGSAVLYFQERRRRRKPRSRHQEGDPAEVG
jgi:hypothetical protein